jgi:hypothetical protein
MNSLTQFKKVRVLSVAIALLLLIGRAYAIDVSPDPVIYWSNEARRAIVPPAAGPENYGNKFPGEAGVYMGIVHVAIYDAAVAIEGGYEFYAHYDPPINVPVKKNVRKCVRWMPSWTRSPRSLRTRRTHAWTRRLTTHIRPTVEVRRSAIICPAVGNLGQVPIQARARRIDPSDRGTASEHFCLPGDESTA